VSPAPVKTISLKSPNRTRARVGVPPFAFVYVTAKANVVEDVPFGGETPPWVRVTEPHVADNANTGVTFTNRAATIQLVSATVPTRRSRI
jgi:hypothetical protein